MKNIINRSPADQDASDKRPGEQPDSDFDLSPFRLTPSNIDTIRRSITEFGQLVLVVWFNPRTAIQAPWDWDLDDDPKELVTEACMSVGYAYDLPEEGAVYIRPHLVSNPFDKDKDWSEGEIVIPYGSILSVHPLPVADAEYDRFKDWPSIPNARDAEVTPAEGNS